MDTYNDRRYLFGFDYFHPSTCRYCWVTLTNHCGKCLNLGWWTTEKFYLWMVSDEP